MEDWDVLDREGRALGRTVPGDHHFDDGEYHATVEIWLFDAEDRVLVQKRSLKKKLLPGRWALTCGRVRAGEDPREACVREVCEELGARLLQTPRLVRGPVAEDGIHMLWYFYRAQWPEKAALELDGEEVAEARFVDRENFQAMLDAGLLYRYEGVEAMADLMFSPNTL